MRIVRWDKLLKEYLDDFEAGRIVVNHDYQRTAKVWPPNAQSYLVETVILNLILPRLLLHKVGKGASARSEIVDGQQRSVALLAFRRGELRLTAAVDRRSLKGKLYSTLSKRDRKSFDTYLLAVDRFEEAFRPEIREVFRRLNSYTAPLSAEEKRHARFQGEFKWFMGRQCELYATKLEHLGVLSESNLNRMLDAKLLSEIAHAILNGITTTSATTLNNLYKTYDKDFDVEPILQQRFLELFRFLDTGPRLEGRLSTPFHAYSYFLAISHAMKPVATLTRLEPTPAKIRSNGVVNRNLRRLERILTLEEDAVPKRFQAFSKGSRKGTNVKLAREDRFRAYYRALTRASV
jgi:hypothetical protein